MVLLILALCYLTPSSTVLSKLLLGADPRMGGRSVSRSPA